MRFSGDPGLSDDRQCQLGPGILYIANLPVDRPFLQEGAAKVLP
jgi:hypothetical protein